MDFTNLFKKDSVEEEIEINPEEFVTRAEFERLKRIVETHHEYLNNIYIFYDLQPTTFLKKMRKLSYELLKFFDNVCKKHNIEYWIDYGTLLGAIRHGGFIPWDDDLDVGMLRSDYNKLIEILPSELEQNNLTNLVAKIKVDKHNLKSKRWYQLSYKHPDVKGKFIGIDFFPYDYVNNYKGKNIESKYNAFLEEYYHNPDEYKLKKMLKKFYEEFNLTKQKDEFFIPGLENARGNLRQFSVYPFKVIPTNQVFPLTTIPFGPYDFKAPKDFISYIKDIYGNNYMQIPRKIRDHGRLNRFRKELNILEMLDEAIDMLVKANKNY